MPDNFTFTRFSELIGEIAKEHFRKPEVIDAFKKDLLEKGRKFSLAEDGKMDSLDITEVSMKLEEMLVEHEGPAFKKLKMEGKDFEDSKNVGEFYEAICKQIGHPPDYAAAA